MKTVEGQPSKMRLLFLAVLILASATACSTTPYNVRGRPAFALPDPGSLSPVERLGYAIYRHDQAAWIATEIALAAGLTNTPAAGWITVEEPDGILVRFAGPCGAEICSYVDVLVGEEATLQAAAAPDPLPPSQAGAWRARRLVSRSNFRACTPTYNTVVLPLAYQGKPAWEVYLLASSKDPSEVVLTGHHRFVVSEDGMSILLAEPLSKSCITTRADESLYAPYVSHILHPRPIATHVFTSLDYHVPLYVVTQTGTYRIEGASITLVSEP